MREFDWIRTALMFEPRGHAMMSGSILYPTTHSDCDIGVLYIETSGCLPMCGHGTIGLIASLGMKSIEGYLKNNPKFSAMTNSNDFILTDGDRDYLRQLFGERTVIYPTGGHLGNLEFVPNMSYMTDFFSMFRKQGGK